MSFARAPYIRKPRAPLVPLSEPSRSLIRRVEADSICVAVPKGPKAKKGKQTPTKAEAEWMDRIVECGCLACRQDFNLFVPAEVHHLLRGGHRMGHLFTIPLCPMHHRQGPFARHPWRRRFEARYGTELQLLAKLKVELGVFDKAEYIA